MKKIKFFKCVLCSSEYEENEVVYTCPKCGQDGVLEIFLDYENIKFDKNFLKERENSILRYFELLPIDDLKGFPPLNVGFTPVYKSKRLNEYLGLENLYIKDDGRNPTASFKDRASALVIKKAADLGYESITTASTGNAASSLSGLSASIGLKTYIFVPETAPKAKIAQLLNFGSKVFAIKGTYDEAFDLCIKATEAFGWYNRNTAYNPYTIEGKKTASFEIWEQLNFTAPDKIFVSVGDGVIYSGIYKGFYDLYSMKLIDKIPQVIGVQAEGASPIVKAFLEGRETIIPIKNPKTIADSISVGYPRNGKMALKYAKLYNGNFISVSDKEILNTIPLLGTLTGVFGEPAGVASLTGLIKMLNLGKIKENEKIVVLITGNGLKDIDSAIKAVEEPYYINNDLNDVKKFMIKWIKGGVNMAESFWDKVKKGLKVGAEKTKEFAEIANLKGSILVLENKKGGKFKDLGLKVYSLYKEGKTPDEVFQDVKNIIDEIKNIENEIKQKEEMIEKIRKESNLKEEDVKEIEKELKKEGELGEDK